MGVYAEWDYELPYPEPDPRNFYHIFDKDSEAEGVADLGGGSLLTICALQSEAMDKAIQTIVDSIDAAIALALQGRGITE